MKLTQRSSDSGGTGYEDKGSTPEEEMGEGGSAESVARTENPAQPGLELPDNAVNLVPYLLEAGASDPVVEKFITEELPSQVTRHFDEDWEARKGWMEKRKERIALFLGDIKTKQEPFRNCANLHNPLMLKSTLRLVSRTWAEIFADGQPLFRAKAGSKMTEEQADTITKHENWQFTKEIPDFPSHVWRALVEFFRDGECIFDSYRDYVNNTNRHEYLSPDEFVYPYARHPTAPDMSDVPRKTKLLFPYKRDLMEMAELGFYAQVEKVTDRKGSHDISLDQPVKDAVDKFEGVDRTDHECDAPYALLEQHTWVKLPYAEKEEPFRVVVDRRTKTVLGLYSRYYDDPEDRVRLDRETAEFQGYLDQLQQYAQILQEEQNTLAAIQQPHVPANEAMEIAEQVQRERPPEPMRPQWLTFDEQGNPKPPLPCKQKIIERFSRTTCVDNPEGSHGLGLGLLMMPHQMAANIMLNQAVDQATLANSTTIIMHDMVKLPPGMTTINPNEIIKVRGVPPDQVEKAVQRIQHSPANTQLLSFVQAQEAAVESISSAPDVLSGEKEGDETFRGMATRVEQATKQLSALAAKFMMVMNQVAKNNALLNFWFLPESKQVDARNPATGTLEPITVSRDLYRDRYDIEFSADLSFASRATKVSEADDAMGLLLKGIPPQILTMVMRPEGLGAAIRKCLHARGMFDIAAYLYSDQEIGMRMMQQAQAAAMAQGGPGGPPGARPPGAPPPSTPDGQPSAPPPGPQNPPGTPAEVAPNVQ